jgi:hypothetical protein
VDLSHHPLSPQLLRDWFENRRSFVLDHLACVENRRVDGPFVLVDLVARMVFENRGEVARQRARRCACRL